MKTKPYAWIMLAAIVMVAGVILSSCSEDREESEYQVHPDGWVDPASANFHGNPAITNGGAACTECHGGDFRGGSSGESCYDCHTVLHNTMTLATHRPFVAALNWDITGCTHCHGADYTGGTSGFNCTSCHAQPAGPANCATCHGTPPTDNDGLPYGMPDGAFGAHDAHARFACTECHAQVTNLEHTGPLPADVSFVGAHIANARDYSPSSLHIGALTSGNATCATYCHSDGHGGPPVALPQWVGGGLSCGGCHDLPPSRQGHPQVGTCHLCHTNVDPSSNYPNDIRFVNEALHVDGVVEQ